MSITKKIEKSHTVPKNYGLIKRKKMNDAVLPKGIVLDMFAGSGTTLVVAKKLGRRFIGCELNPEYVRIARKRLKVF